MNFLFDIPPFLLIALGLAIVNGIKWGIEKLQERRRGGGSGGGFDWPQQDNEPDWFDPETYEQPTQAPPAQRRAPAREVSVPPPAGTPIPAPPTPSANKRSAPLPTWGTQPAASSQQDLLTQSVSKPQLSKAEKDALQRIKKRKGRKRRGHSGASAILDLSERDYLRTQLRHPRSARHAIALAEVLGPPVALKD